MLDMIMTATTEQYEDDEDDISAEGAITRNLFRTESDDDEDDDDSDDDAVACTSSSPALSTEMFVERPVMDICLYECKRQNGASIAEQLWPAAQYLAQYVINVNDGAWQPPPQDVSEMNASDSASNQDARAAVQKIFEQQSHPLRIVEVGAGVGMTGMQLATRFDAQVLLTDLPEAVPLLERNIQLNRERFHGGPGAVRARVLEWGNEDHAERIIQEWQSSDGPVLVLASDCVYHAELHLPLEQTLAALLSNAPKGSVCLIAGARRWKRDTKFYARLGKATRSTTHCLSTSVLQETITRNDKQERQILRVYCVQWLSRGRL